MSLARHADICVEYSVARVMSSFTCNDYGQSFIVIGRPACRATLTFGPITTAAIVQLEQLEQLAAAAHRRSTWTLATSLRGWINQRA